MSSSDSKIEHFIKTFPAVDFPKNFVVTLAGEKSEYFYAIKTGVVKMTNVSKNGRNIILHLFFPGSFFPLLALINNGSNAYDLATMSPVTAYKIPRQTFVNFLKNNTDVMYELQLRLLKGLDGLLKRLEKSLLEPVPTQIASLLLYFARHLSSKNSVKSNSQIQLVITHQEIADWLGLSRENVSIHMKNMQRTNIIMMNKHHIEIVNQDELEKLANETP